MPRFRSSAHRRDDNHKAVVKALRAAGWYVIDTSQAGDGCPDVFALKGGRVVPVEIKDGAKVASRRQLSESEQAVHAACLAAGVRVAVIETIEEAVRL